MLRACRARQRVAPGHRRLLDLSDPFDAVRKRLTMSTLQQGAITSQPTAGPQRLWPSDLLTELRAVLPDPASEATIREFRLLKLSARVVLAVSSNPGSLDEVALRAIGTG